MQNCLTRTISNSFLAFISLSMLLACPSLLVAEQPPESSSKSQQHEVHAGQGIMAGEVTDLTALMQMRLDQD